MIPIILGGVAAATALYGVVAGADGVSNFKKAKKIGEAAQDRHRGAIAAIQKRRDEVAARAKTYGNYLLKLNDTTLKEMRELLTRLQKNPRTKDLRLPADVAVAGSSLESYKSNVLDPPNDLVGAVSAIGAGAAAGSSAVGLVGLLGTASTGTAIGSLSGAAATNATLAWLGGGSLAAGGGGMALGTVVLGGVVAGPALAVTGFVVGSKGEKALTEARRYAKQANVQVAKLNTAREFLGRLKSRIEELDGLAKKLNRRARKAMAAIDPDVFDADDEQQLADLTLALQLVVALSEVMQTPILDKDGELTAKSQAIQLKYQEN